MPEPGSDSAPPLLPASRELPLDRIQLPPGFSIELYSQQTFPARFMALGHADENVTVVYVSSTQSVVTALVDRRSSGGGVQACTLLEGQDNPNGVAYDSDTGSLYVAEVRALTRHDGVDEAALAGCDTNLLTSTVVAGPELLPPQASHANRALGIGPDDGFLYYTVAAPFNVDHCEDPYCSIHRIAKNGTDHEIWARGIRNAAGWDWHPDTGDLLFVGMERDSMGNDIPDDVLVAADVSEQGLDFAWPYCHWVGNGPPEQREPGPGQLIPDPDVIPEELETNGRPTDDELIQRCREVAPPPIQALGPHVAPLGALYWGPTSVAAQSEDAPSAGGVQQWPTEYDGGVFVGEHGSWDRDDRIGYRVAYVKLSEDGRQAVGHTVFADGWLNEDGSRWGRPVGLLRLPDASMLLADDFANVVYRISYSGDQGSQAAAPAPTSPAAGPAPLGTQVGNGAGARALTAPATMWMLCMCVLAWAALHA